MLQVIFCALLYCENIFFNILKLDTEGATRPVAHCQAGAARMNQRYIIAIKRERRDTVSSNWKEPLRSIAGLAIVGDDDPLRVQVEATDEAIAEARRLLGDCCHIESVIMHRPLN